MNRSEMMLHATLRWRGNRDQYSIWRLFAAYPDIFSVLAEDTRGSDEHSQRDEVMEEPQKKGDEEKLRMRFG